MKNPKVQLVVVAVLLMVAGLLLIPSLTQAKPKGVPAWQADEPQRDGYSQTYVIDANSVLVEVPEGECFVLLRLYSYLLVYDYHNFPDGESVWTLTVDGEMFLNELGLYDPLLLGDLGMYTSTTGLYRGDFPDRCVVVRGGQTLGITMHDSIEKMSITLIGYFCDVP